MIKKIVIEGKNIVDIDTFYEEINRVFMPNENWRLGNSLDGLNDLLYGSFGEIVGSEPVEIQWKDIEHVKAALGLETTRAFYEQKRKDPLSFNQKWVEEKIHELETNKGETYFEIVLNIFADHPNLKIIPQ